MNGERKKGISKEQGVSCLGRGRNYKSPWRWQGVGVTCFVLFGSGLPLGSFNWKPANLPCLQHDYLFMAEGS